MSRKQSRRKKQPLQRKTHERQKKREIFDYLEILTNVPWSKLFFTVKIVWLLVEMIQQHHLQ